MFLQHFCPTKWSLPKKDHEPRDLAESFGIKLVVNPSLGLAVDEILLGFQDL